MNSSDSEAEDEDDEGDSQPGTEDAMEGLSDSMADGVEEVVRNVSDDDEQEFARVSIQWKCEWFRIIA